MVSSKATTTMGLGTRGRLDLRRKSTIMTAFEHTVSSVDELSNLYRSPSDGVVNKETPVLDHGCRDFIKQSTFVLVGTSSLEGKQDVSPRGGPAGFVKVLDDYHLIIPDLNGNNRLDSIRNIIEQETIGLLFIIPGLGETLRINGRGCITTDDSLLELFSEELRKPKAAIGVTVETGFIHCAKSFMRSGMWEPETWPKKECTPSPGKMLVDHSGMGGSISGEERDQLLEEGYKVDLAADLPETNA
jgi:PPOX class probable FMN-dependent enzyme